ncbi:GNAT family N-acetyltransferase [Candidatus Enterococcus clewellii]|uniref:N-acetyltransferase domain-containing protein n=1 Tax=Candidatus Enterococcus clewellii TaxID=1834193 RepID=A0A242KDR9_9ENTE|nr:GNAT family N-acetyltransferase [Enterococcus sp. 9E7_DIV0242]OTP19219.1 hypothetical protein A5888_001034 [Enterococcus sp. 9E7_DIV0242]
MIKGKRIRLVPATLADRQDVYDWCFQSETTRAHSGPPDYPEKTIATYEEFCAEYYEEYYFTGEKPNEGRGYMIIAQGVPVGFISYSAFHLKPSFAELDIWMNSEANCGKGYGTEALMLLGEYLNETLSIKKLIIAPSAKNKRAIRSYEKAGFKQSEKAMFEFLLPDFVSLYGSGDYGEENTAVMTKQLGL